MSEDNKDTNAVETVVEKEINLDYAITFTEDCFNDTIPTVISDDIKFKTHIDAYQLKEFTITPTEDSIWTFTSFVDKDTYAYLYQGDQELDVDDDSGYSGNFKIEYEFATGDKI